MNRDPYIRLPKCKIRMLVFILYNFLYVTYMMGYTSQTLYLGTLILFCGMNICVFIIFNSRNSNVKCLAELKHGLNYIGIFFIISLAIQLIHLDFESYLISGIIRITLPVINAFFIVNSTSKEDQEYFFDILLARFILNFVWENIGNLNIHSILSISWADSSSDMESSLAHDFLIMELFFLYKKDKIRSIICIVLCMLSLKRLSFILAPFFFAIARYVPSGKEVKRIFCFGLISVAVISPFIILALYSDPVVDYLQYSMNINLNEVMSGRPRIYYILRDNIPYYNGYASVNSFLDKFVRHRYGTMWNNTLHNDFLRIYLETTIIGVIALAYNLVELSKKEYWTFFMMCYLIFVAITSHILNYFSVWISFYMIVMYIAANEPKEEKVRTENENFNNYGL